MSSADPITTKFLENSLKHGLQEPTLKIKQQNLQPATGPGYASTMHRGQLQLQGTPTSATEILNVFIKSLPEARLTLKTVKEMNYFGVETLMLSQILTKMETLTNNGQNRLCPKLYSGQQSSDVIIMEDLTANGFKMANMPGLDLEHAELVLKTYAKFHASSFIVCQNEPEMKMKFDDFFFHTNHRVLFETFFKNGFKGFLLKIQNYPEVSSCISKLRNLESSLVDELLRTVQRQDTEFNTILHGDAWMNNIMFKYNDQQPIEAKLIDFQLSNYNSHVIDIMQFIFTSVRPEVTAASLDHMLDLYHSQLMAHSDLQHVSYSFDDFKTNLKKKLFFGMVCACVIMPMACSLPVAGVRSNINQNDILKSVVKNLLPIFERHGLY